LKRPPLLPRLLAHAHGNGKLPHRLPRELLLLVVVVVVVVVLVLVLVLVRVLALVLVLALSPLLRQFATAPAACLQMQTIHPHPTGFD
jgi:hypothetical protein